MDQKAQKGKVTVAGGDVRKADTKALIINGADAFPEDSFVGSYWTGGQTTGAAIIQPTYPPTTLKAVCAQNNTLLQCIEAMEVNIDGTGHSIDLIDGEAEDEAEKKMLEDFFNEPFPGKNMEEIRREYRRDLEQTGTGYFEVLRNLEGAVVAMNQVPNDDMRLVRLDAAVPVDREVARNGKPLKLKIMARERRFVQNINGKKIYFKEFGSARGLNKETGEWEENLPPEKRASEIIYEIGNKEPKTPYGSPRWINQLPSALGSRKAEEFNLEYFDAGGLPPVLVVVQGGTLGEQATGDLKRHLSGKGNKHRAAVVEAVSTSGSLDSAGAVQVKVERFGCVDDQTEVLTVDGWVPIKGWVGGAVATVVNGKLEYQDPLQYHVYDFSGDLIHIEGAATEFMVTPTHRVWYQQPRDKAMRFEFASHSVTRSNLVVPVAPQQGFGAELHLNFMVAGKQYLQGTWLDFLGMFIADGSTTGHDSNPNTITISVKKSRKKEFIQTFMPLVASESGGKYSSHDYDDGYTRYSIFDKALRDWLRSMVGTKASEKKIPPQYLQLGQVQSERLLQAMLQGDGHFNGEDSKCGWTYTTVSPRLADDVQTLALHAGYRSVLSKVKNREEYCVSLTPKTTAHVTKGKCPAWGLVPYKGKVYCFTMATGVFVTRRNGRVCITGNSERQSDAMFQSYDKNCEEHIRVAFRLPPLFLGKASDFNFATAYTAYMVAEAQVFYPEREQFDNIINTKIVRALGAKKYKFRSLPLTLLDVKNQMEALKLASDKNFVDGEQVVKTLNELVGMALEYKEPPETPPPPVGKIDPLTGLPYTQPVPPQHPPEPAKEGDVQLTATGEPKPKNPADKARPVAKADSALLELAALFTEVGMDELCNCASHME